GSNERLLDTIALTRAQILLDRGEPAAAREAVDEVLARAAYPQRKDAPGLSSILFTASRIALGAGDPAMAEQYANDGYEIVSGIARDPSRSADVGQLLLLRAKARRALGNSSGAAADLERAILSLGNGFGPDHPETLEA